MLGYLLVIAAVVAAAGIAVWQWKQAQKRREALFVFATTRGWTFAVEDPSLVDHWVGKPFGQGDHRRVTNVIRGAAGERCLTAFDYTYETTTTTGGRTERTTHHDCVVVIGMAAYLPTVEVTPESLLDRVGSAVGLTQDIELESEDFNRRFRITAYDPKFASDVLTPRTMELLLARPAVAFRIQGTDVISWSPGPLDPVAVVERSSTLGAVIDAIPEFVWRDHGAAS